MGKNLIALKPYLESVDRICSPLPKERLIQILLGLAKEVPAVGRGDFLRTVDRLSREMLSRLTLN